MSSDHSILAPSSASVWSQCPGSVLAAMAYPDTRDKTKANEGTMAHDAAAEFLGQMLQGEDVTIEDEAVRMYCEEVAKDFGEGRTIGIEERIDCSTIHSSCFGTTDAYVFDGVETLTVYDLKYGMGVVEARENKQLLTYLLGLCVKFPQATKYKLVIVQPRAFAPGGPVRSWELTRDEAVVYWEKLRAAAELATSADPKTVSGSHCKYCTMRWACPAALAAVATLYEGVGSYVPHVVDDEDLGALYTAITRAQEHLANMVVGIESEIEARIRHGEAVNGYQLKASKGREAWTIPVERAIALGMLFGKDIAKPGVLTPAQARNEGITIPAEYTQRPSSMQVKQINAAEVFGRK